MAVAAVLPFVAEDMFDVIDPDAVVDVAGQ
jgi:hypothetical protein